MLVGQKVIFPYEEHGKTVFLSCEVKEILPNGWVYVESELRSFKAEETEFLEGELDSSTLSFIIDNGSKYSKFN